MPKLPLLLLTFLLIGCTPSHFYTGPTGGAIASLQEKVTVYEDRNGETLRETYKPTGIDGKVLFHFRSAAIEGQYHVSPGSHKILARASIRRGGFGSDIAEYFGVLHATFVENKHYILTGVPRFADNQLEMWVEDSETGARVSDPLSLDLSNPVQRPNIITYPIYIPAVKTGR
jgi:hypothetical protein